MVQQKVWKRLDRPDFGLADTISDVIDSLESSNPNLLTDLRLVPSLILTCDYSGQHKQATHETYAFLIADFAFTWLWDTSRKDTRHQILRDNRRMCFKSLNDSRRRRALVPFLRAANTIPGLLLTVLIDKHIDSIFNHGEVQDTDPFRGLQTWPRPTLERFLRMAHIGSLLLAGLSGIGQDILWITDEDDIVANSGRIVDGTRAISNISSHYMRHSLGHLRYGSTKSNDSSFFIEDLASVPDLAAGAVNELASHGLDSLSKDYQTLLSSDLSLKARCIMGWLGDGQLHPLKRIVLALSARESRSINVRAISLKTEGPVVEYMWHHDFLRIVKDGPGYVSG